MILSKQLSLFSVAVLLCSSFVSTVSAEFVTFEFNGVAQATVDGIFFPSVDFTIATTIDSNTPDEFPNESQRGGFIGATTTLSLFAPALPNEPFNPARFGVEIFDAPVTNVTGILQEQFGNSTLNLVDATDGNLFGQNALSVAFSQAVFPDPNSINPLIGQFSVNNAQGGLPLRLLAGPDVTLNSASASSITGSSGFTSSANVPEPTSFTLCGIGLLAVAFKRRRRSRG